MQFILPKTPSLKEYFFGLNPAKRAIFLLTVLAFVLAGSSLALGLVASINSGAKAPGGAGLAAPVDYFSKALKGTKALAPESPGEPKTVPSPLNGVLYSETAAKDWQGRRPMAVVINNHFLARPQTGLAQADLIYEAVAEGGISRLVAIFHSQLPEKVGPVRSARKYFVDFAKENDAWYAHWGGASTANEANVYDYMRSIFVSSVDAMWAGDQAFWRDFSRNIPSEHTGYTSVPKLYETAYRRYPDQPKAWPDEVSSWLFKEDVADAERGPVQSIEFNFWDVPDFQVKWTYQRGDNNYARAQGRQASLDAESNQPLTAKDVVVLFMDERWLSDGYSHLLYKTLGQGTGKAFLDGQVFEIAWSRRSVAERTRFFLIKNGKKTTEELKLNRGQIWLEILPTGTTVTYQ